MKTASFMFVQPGGIVRTFRSCPLTLLPPLRYDLSTNVISMHFAISAFSLFTTSFPIHCVGVRSPNKSGSKSTIYRAHLKWVSIRVLSDNMVGSDKAWRHPFGDQRHRGLQYEARGSSRPMSGHRGFNVHCHFSTSPTKVSLPGWSH
jgi:hypothetical protein